MRRDLVSPVAVHGHKGLGRLTPEQRDEVRGIVTRILGRPGQGAGDLEAVIYLLAGNVPAALRGGDELRRGVKTALVIAEKYQRGEFDAESLDLFGRVNPFHEVAELLRAVLERRQPERPRATVGAVALVESAKP